LEKAVETEVFHSQTFKQTIQNNFLDFFQFPMGAKAAFALFIVVSPFLNR